MKQGTELTNHGRDIIRRGFPTNLVFSAARCIAG